MFSIPINKITLTPAIITSIKKYNGDMSITSKKVLNDGSLPQSRMDDMIEAFKNGKFSNGDTIPPIKVRMRSDGYYNIIDGRHRFVASVVFNNTTIDCTFC